MQMTHTAVSGTIITEASEGSHTSVSEDLERGLNEYMVPVVFTPTSLSSGNIGFDLERFIGDWLDSFAEHMPILSGSQT